MGQSTLSAQDLQRAVALLGLVQEEFAEKFGVRHASVSRWLSGKVPVPAYVERWLADVHPEIYAEIKGGQNGSNTQQ